ncbi:MAG: hypothetical protein MK066_04835 [Crocinitomicaceae bacterium]|nr:hypothetical protein [Crocinitomicaceae bacterium]
MKKLIFISFAIAIGLTSCQEDPILPNDPCANWWQNLILVNGAVLEDTNNDGEPDVLTYVDANGNSTTYTCVDDLNGDCIPDCFEQFIDNGQGNGNNPCAGWWANLIWVNGAVLEDTNNDGEPDVLTYVDANGTSTTYTCVDDLNGNCIPDCFEQFIDNGQGNGNGNNPCAGWWANLIWVNGAVLEDTNNDGEPDVLTYVDANGNSTTYTCVDDLNGDCIPDCFEQFIDNGQGNGSGNNPCVGWWANLILVNGAVFEDINNDGEPDALTYVDANGTSTTYTCFDDLNGDCIPDCFEQFVL